MAESTENCMKTGACFALLAMTFETCDLLNFTQTDPNIPHPLMLQGLTYDANQFNHVDRFDNVIVTARVQCALTVAD